MTDEMIEEIALAICLEQALTEEGPDGKACDGSCVTCRNQARAAVQAHKIVLFRDGLGIRPREATEEMTMAGQHAYDKTDCGLTDAPSPIEAAWQEMWDRHPDKPDG